MSKLCPSSFCLLLAIASLVGSTTAFLPPSAVNKQPYIDYPRRIRISAVKGEKSGAPSTTRAKDSKKAGSKNGRAKRGSPKQRKYHKSNNYSGGPRSDFEKAKILNQKLASGQSAQDVLSVLASTDNALTGLAAGGKMNSVNFSTALHRIGRHSFRDDTRAAALKDPRFALFMCSLAEAVSGLDYTKSIKTIQEEMETQTTTRIVPGKNSLIFKPREWSNIAWAIAKLRLAPPKSAFPLDTSEEVVGELVQASFQLRSQVLEAARLRKQGKLSADSPWIATLSKVSGLLMDSISHTILTTTKNFNTQEWANLLWAMATAGRADEVVSSRVTTNLIHSMKAMQKDGLLPKPQEISNSLWALATAGVHSESEALMELTADLLDTKEEYIAQFKPQELSNSAWGIATILTNKRTNNDEENDSGYIDTVALRILRHIARSIAERADEFKSQELSNTAWAFATLGFGYNGLESANSLNDYIYLTSDDPEGDRMHMSRALDAIAETSLPRLNVFKTQELNNLAWSYARLNQKETSKYLYEGIGNQFRQRRRRFSPQDIGTTLWSFATMEYFDEEIYRIICSRLTIDQGSRFKPQEVSNTVWALATAQVIPKYPDAFDTTLVHPSMRLSLDEMSDDPVTLCFAAASNELMKRPSEFKTQETKDVLWSFSKVGVRHPPLFKAVADHLVGAEPELNHQGRGLDGFSPQGLGNLAWSYAKQAQLADEAAERIEGSGRGTSGRLAIYATICIDIGESQIQRLFSGIADAGLQVHDGLSKLKPQDMANTAWAFATLGLFHKRFFDAVAVQVIRRLSSFVSKKSGNRSADYMTRFKGQELANIVWAFATLNYPAPTMLEAIAPYAVLISSNSGGSSYDVHSISRQFKRQEIANILWSCAVFGTYPRDLMQLMYVGLLGEGNESNPDMLSRVYNDGGMQMQAIMTLLYVQLLVHIEAPDINLSLPPNFPEGWDTASSSLPDVDTNTASPATMLSLSSSKTQKDVSSSLQRIGFDHVQEHVLGAEELLETHGAELSSSAHEILSIDMANLEQKIGIEVDGPSHFITVVDGDGEHKVEEKKERGYAKVLNGKLAWQFMWEGKQKMNGPTALKERLLSHFGWTLIHVPFWEWDALDASAEAEDKYTTEMLKNKRNDNVY